MSTQAARAEAPSTAPSKKFFKVEIVKATPLLFGNNLADPFHIKMVGKKIFVRQVDLNSAYFETKSGNSILRWDVKRIVK